MIMYDIVPYLLFIGYTYDGSNLLFDDSIGTSRIFDTGTYEFTRVIPNLQLYYKAL